METRLELNYGRPARGRRQIVLRLIVAAVLSGVAYHYGPHVYRQSRLLLFQHRAMGYVAPVDTIGFPLDFNNKPSPPGVIEKFLRESNAPVIQLPVAFAGALKNKNGSRLVIVEAGRVDCGSSDRVTHVTLLYATVISPASWTGHPVFGSHLSLDVRRPTAISPTTKSVGAGDKETEWLRIFAGNNVTDDATAFEIHYVMNGTAGVIRGKLLDDDSIDLREATPMGPWWKTHGYFRPESPKNPGYRTFVSRRMN